MEVAKEELKKFQDEVLTYNRISIPYRHKFVEHDKNIIVLRIEFSRVRFRANQHEMILECPKIQ